MNFENVHHLYMTPPPLPPTNLDNSTNETLNSYSFCIWSPDKAYFGASKSLSFANYKFCRIYYSNHRNHSRHSSSTLHIMFWKVHLPLVSHDYQKYCGASLYVWNHLMLHVKYNLLQSGLGFVASTYIRGYGKKKHQSIYVMFDSSQLKLARLIWSLQC